MFASWGRAVHRARWLTIAVAGVVGLLAAVYGAGVFGSLSAGGFADPDSESARATQLLEQGAGRTAADVVVLYRSEGGTVDDAGYERAVTRSLAALPTERVESAATYWSTRDERLVTADRRSTYAVLVLAGEDDSARAEDYEAIRDRLDVPGLDVRLGGPEAVFADVSEQVEADIARAETISLPIVLVLCVLIYGSVVAASLPLLVGGIAVLGAFAAVRALTTVTDVSVFSINIITLLGLGLAIDYALFVVTRFREELARSASVEDAVAATVATAGRTIAWSGLTVAICLASLLVFPQTFLRSMGLGGVAAVLVAMTAALTVLPAVLGVLGRRVDALRVMRRPRRDRDGDSDGGWARVAAAVMRRPLLLGGAVLVLLLGLGAPFLGVSFGGVDARTLPESAQSRQVSEAVAQEFPGGGTSVAEVVVTGLPGPLVEAYADAVALVPGVADVSVRGAGTGPGEPAPGSPAVVSVAYGAEAQSQEARDVVSGIRDVPVPAGGEALVRGETAQLVDLLGSLRSTLPWMAVLVVVTTFVLLFAAFGSVVLPLKAIAVAALSLTASFGVVVWVFQHGNGADLLGFTTTGYIDATQPILMLAVLFGLSMDYELFLLSRVREEWDRTHDNERAVAVGLQRTGRIITSAALLLLVVVGGFSTSGITFITMMGVGMIVALVVDATLVRAVLVPATMRLLGDANWYAPAPLARWWERSGLREQDASTPARRAPRHRADDRSLPAPTPARVLVGAGRRAG